MSQKIKVHIKELVLHGFERIDRRRVGVAVESELSRLFTEQGVPSSLTHGSECPSIDGGKFKAAHNSGTESIGSHIAQAVYGGLGKK